MRGLKGVYFDTTEASFIDGEKGELFYRGYNIHAMAEKSTFEEVIYLLLYGALLNRQQLHDFDGAQQGLRAPETKAQLHDAGRRDSREWQPYKGRVRAGGRL